MDKLSELEKESNHADAAYEQLLADECMDVFVLDEALMEAYEVKTRYVRALKRRIIELEG